MAERSGKKGDAVTADQNVIAINLAAEWTVVLTLCAFFLYRHDTRLRAAYRRWRARHRRPCPMCRDTAMLVHRYVKHHLHAGDLLLMPDEMNCPHCYRIFKPSWSDALRGMEKERRSQSR